MRTPGSTTSITPLSLVTPTPSPTEPRLVSHFGRLLSASGGASRSVAAMTSRGCSPPLTPAALAMSPRGEGEGEGEERTRADALVAVRNGGGNAAAVGDVVDHADHAEGLRGNGTASRDTMTLALGAAHQRMVALRSRMDRIEGPVQQHTFVLC